MDQVKKLIKEVISKHLKKEDKCNCGCHTCENVGNQGVLINESLNQKINLTENLQYHVDNKLPLTENTFRYGSQSFLDLWAEARYLYVREAIHVNDDDKEILTETNLGEYGLYEGVKVPLDLPMLEEEELEEADKKKNPSIGKPKRGGSKKFYVYVRDKGKIKKVSFGDTSGLSAKINNPEARRAFAKRHDCANKKDRTKASYWSCRLPRYAKLLGLKSSFSGFW
jgi:hypothetical protein